MTFPPPNAGSPDQARLEIQQQLEKLFIQAKTSQLEAEMSRYVRPVFGKRPAPPGPFERVLQRVSKKRRRSQKEAMLRESGFFNDDWYLRQYPDVAAADMDPAYHYLNHGAAELRDPGPDFSTRHYLAMYPDVRENGINPLLHYLYSGWDEMRVVRPSSLHLG